MHNPSGRMPLLFVGHGSPMNAIEDNAFSARWQALAGELPKPRAILCVSAHFVTQGTQVVGAAQPETIHDFWGFPQALYDIRYPAPGAPALADRVRHLLPEVAITHRWGLDHGAWSVLRRMWPQADIPVAQLSVDVSLSGDQQLRIGRALAPLRDAGVLILGSGNVVHNLRLIDPGMTTPFAWARSFDEAVRQRVLERRYNELADYGALPGARESVPTTEHFVPLLYVLGAAEEQDTPEAFLPEYVFGSLSMTGFVLR